MQTPFSPSRSNRIPRATPTQPGLCRRLHRWLRVTWLQRRAEHLAREVRALQHGIALDKAAIAAYGLQGREGETLLLRMDIEHKALERTLCALAVVERDLRRAEVWA
jgi:hypothetical protein